MPYLGNEETLVELPAIEYIQSKLGFEFIHGDNLIPEYNERESITEVILTSRFEKALKRLNPWMDKYQINKAIRYLTRPEKLGASTLEINEKIFDSIVNLTYTVEGTDSKGHKKEKTVTFIDFENPEKNDFLVTRQFVVKGPQETIRPDIVIFINGIPVVVLECKSPFIEGSEFVLTGKYDAFTQLKRYANQRESQISEGAERLFYTNFFTGILNKYHAYLGTISASHQDYLEWKDPYPFKTSEIEDYKNLGQNIFIQGILHKENLLDIMRNFILFEGSSKSGKKVKKICRYQQYRAVNKALKRLKTGTDKLSRGGVIWHTQGSGKSLAMVYLAIKIRRDKKLYDSTIVVVTDRDDLDKQIYRTFLRTLHKYTEPIRAKTIKHLKELLSNPKAQIITTLIQKFQTEDEVQDLEDKNLLKPLTYKEKFEVLTTKSNVIVLADEAHRSQYKIMAKNMRDALPNAAFIGFTGTPIDKKDKSTSRTFGTYIDKYFLHQAVEDGATVEIVYEGRKPKLQIKGKKLDDIFNREFEERTEKEREAIKLKYVNKLAILEAMDRIEEISKDILIHYKENIYPNGFKAQIVTPSRDAAVTYYDMLNKYIKDTIGKDLGIKIVYTASPNDEPRLKEHLTTKAEQQKIISSFLKPISEDNLCFIIVVDMLLTGFDAPIEQVMYLDKPLIEHNLLQAIARVNRVYSDNKKCGYIIDYYGVSNFLDQALAIFDAKDIGTPMASVDDIIAQMKSYREDVMRIFYGVDKNDIDALLEVITPEDKRTEFEISYKRFAETVEILLPSHVTQEFINDLQWLSYIRAAAKARFTPQDEIDISGCGQKVKKIISEHLKAKGVSLYIKPVTLFGKDFEKMISKMDTDKGRAISMEKLIRHTISVKINDNPVYYTSLLEKLKKILEETEENWLERKNRLKEFIQKDIKTGEEDAAKKYGISKEEFAIFEAVRKQLSKTDEFVVSEEDTELLKKITSDIDKTIKGSYVIDWTTNITKTQNIERSIKNMLISGYYNKFKMEGINRLVPQVVNIAKVHYATV
jgi:type I restriction enzyme, R subunit